MIGKEAKPILYSVWELGKYKGDFILMDLVKRYPQIRWVTMKRIKDLLPVSFDRYPVVIFNGDGKRVTILRRA